MNPEATRYAAIAAGSLSIAAVVYLIYRRRRRKALKASKWQQPFKTDTRRTREPLESDRDKRAARLKRAFDVSEIPAPLDAIIIGSGVGGLTIAAILAKTGRKCLVLEQHNRAGGCSHTFSKDGTEFDIGLHYIGEMAANADLRFFIDQLTEGQLDWAEMDADYDEIVVPAFTEEDHDSKPVTVAATRGETEFLNKLITRFPEEEKGLREFFRLVMDAAKLRRFIGLLKLVPSWLASFLISFRWLFPSIRKFFYYYHELKLQSVLDDLFPKNKQLQLVLGYCWGDTGVEPTRAGFGMHALMLNHYYRYGAYYPVGGASEIAYTMIPIIEKSGGRVLGKARVKEILLSSDQKTAIGVRVECGKDAVDIRAPLVISSVGVSNTFSKLLPPSVSLKTSIGRLLQDGTLTPSCRILQIFVGLSGSQHDLELPKRNYFVCGSNADIERWFAMDLSEAAHAKIPFLFFGFPSAKDPTYAQRCPDRSNCVILMIVPGSWFQPWAHEKKGKRADEYYTAKMAIAEQAWEQVIAAVPAIADRRRYFDAGSPATAHHYINALHGESYGLDHGPNRFSPKVVPALRPKVPEIENFYLSGQDVDTAGFVGAMMGAFMCAHAVLEASGETSNLMGDAVKLFKRSLGKCHSDKKSA